MQAWSLWITPKHFCFTSALDERCICIAKIVRLSRMINYFFSASQLLLLVSTSSINNNNNHYIHDVVAKGREWVGECARGPVKYACVQTGATNACGSLRCRRRLFRSTTDFSRIFSRPLYHPTALQSAILHLSLHRTRHFVPCRRPFVAFLSSAGFRSCSRCTSGKRRRWLAAADGRLKITATFLFFSSFRAVVRRFRVGAIQPCVSGDNITQFRYTCGARQSHNAFSSQWITYCLILFHIIYRYNV